MPGAISVPRANAGYPIDGPHKQRLLEWLLTPRRERDPTNEIDLAAELGVHRDRMRGWKKDPEFLAEWERRYREVVGGPDRAQEVIAALHETATDRTDPRQVPAARAYLEAIDAIKPKKIDVTVTKAAKDLSEDDLYAILAEKAALALETNRAG